jgi:hypothetical protein
VSDAQPKPSKTLIVLSAIVIAGSLLAVSATIATQVIEPNPLLWFGILLFLPLVLALAIQQYRGTFRRTTSAAKVAGVILYVLGGLATFALLSTVGEAIGDGTSLWLMYDLLTCMSMFAAVCLVAGRMNWVWSRTLRAAVADADFAARRWRFSLREMLLWFSLVAMTIGVACLLVRSTPPRFAEHVPASAAPLDLPPGATDVSYSQGVRGAITIEFSVDEDAFREWVANGIGSIEAISAHLPLREITTHESVRRYTIDSDDPDDDGRVTVSNGLYYYWSEEDREVHAVFDRTTGRAYYSAHYN